MSKKRNKRELKLIPLIETTKQFFCVEIPSRRSRTFMKQLDALRKETGNCTVSIGDHIAVVSYTHIRKL